MVNKTGALFEIFVFQFWTPKIPQTLLVHNVRGLWKQTIQANLVQFNERGLSYHFKLFFHEQKGLRGTENGKLKCKQLGSR